MRWALRALAWLAFAISAYLAWSAITSTPVAGCGVGSENGCDAVLNSPWSKWLGIPVAVLGLGCYASLAGLSVLLGIRSAASPWIATVFSMLAWVAAGASLWFIGIQIFAIGAFCKFCIVTDVCGILIGILATSALIRGRANFSPMSPPGTSTAALSSLRSAIPSSHKSTPVAAPNTATATKTRQAVPATNSRTVALVGATPKANFARRSASPSYAIAVGGATALLGLLIAGQIVFPAKMYEVQQVALNQTLDLGNTSGEANAGTNESTDDATSRVALRIPPDDVSNALDASPSEDAEDDATSPSVGDTPTTSDDETDSSASSEEPVADSSKRSRKVSFLGGKLTLDTYEQPIIGSPEAPKIVVEIVSYDCSHCRKMHRMMKQALARYGDQVALVVLPLPLDRECNKLITDPAASHAGACSTAKFACSISKIKPGSFPRFHDYLMTGDEPPPRESIIARAYRTADRRKLQEMRESEEISKDITSYVDLFSMLRQQNAGNKDFGLPVQILGDHVMSGSVESADDIYQAWEKHLGVEPR